MKQTAAGPVPWAISDARTVFFSTTVGLVAIFVAWWGASGSANLSRQVTWLIVGIGGIVFLGAGNFFWLLAGRRAVGARQARTLDAIVAAPFSAPISTSAPAEAGYVALDGSRRFHVPSCLLVQGKATKPVNPGRRRGVPLQPCEMCRP